MKLFKQDKDIITLPEYKVVQKVLSDIVHSGVGEMFKQNCLGASDLISSMLRHEGINSRLIECFVSIKNSNIIPPFYTFIGYDGLGLKESLYDVHVVVVTDTDTPLLIDMSLGHVLPNNIPFVITQANIQSDIIGEYETSGFQLRYNMKKQPKLPTIHQKNMVDKIKEEEVIKEKLRTLQIFVWVIAAFAAINFTLNVTAVVLKMIYL